MSILASILLSALSLLANPGDQIELTLNTGATVRGELVREDRDTITLRITTRIGELVRTDEVQYDRSLIKEMNVSPSPRDEYKKRLFTLRHEAGDHVTLACWCLDQQLSDEAALHARTALELDSSCAAARDVFIALRFVEGDDGWVPEAAYLADRGLVRIGGEVLPIAEAVVRRRERNEKILRTAADDDLREFGGAAERLQKRLDELKEAVARRTTRIAEINLALATASVSRSEIVERVRHARAALELAQGQQTTERRHYGESLPVTDAAVRVAATALRDALADLGTLDLEVRRHVTTRAREEFEMGEEGKRIARLSESVVKNEQLAADARRRLDALGDTRAGIDAPTGENRGDSRTSGPVAPIPDEMSRTESLKLSVVLVFVEHADDRWGYGSGFFVTEDGSLVTAAHVVEGAKGPVSVAWDTTLDLDPESFRVASMDTAADLALLKPIGKPRRYQPLLVEENYDLGRSLFAVGFPVGVEVGDELGTSFFDLTVSPGALSGVLHQGGSNVPRFLRYDCRQNHGASGGPLVDTANYSVLGVIRRYVQEDELDPAYVATPSRDLLGFLRLADVSLPTR